MTDKEKIRNFVEKVFVENRQRSSIEGYAVVEQLRKVLAYIDSLPEEPSKDLGEAAEKASNCYYLMDVLDDDDYRVLREELKDTFIAGAQWQKEHLMKDAVNAIVCKNISNELRVNSVAIPDNHQSEIKFGDDVKVIIIKEDEQ